MSIYVVDTGEREMYVDADNDYEAAELVAAIGESVKYVEHYSDDSDDIPTGAIVLRMEDDGRDDRETEWKFDE